MRRMMWAVALMLGLAACGGDIAKEAFGTEVVKALCARAERCGQYAQAEACEQDFRQRGWEERLGLGGRYDAALQADRLRYDEDAADRCVEALRETSCARVLPTAIAFEWGIEHTPECRVLLPQETGGTCLSQVECGPDTYCHYDTRQGTARCEGTCRPRGGTGDLMPHPAYCESGLVPSLDTGQCMRPIEKDGLCTRTLDGSPYFMPCAEGLWCDAKGSRRCKPLGEVGEACVGLEEAPCRPFLTCRDGTCRPLAKQGASCWAPDHTSMLPTRECQHELFCDAASLTLGTCKPRRSELGICRDGLDCAEGLYCADARPEVGVSGVCMKLAEVGDACGATLPRPCARGLECSQSYGTGTCQRVVREGDRCGLIMRDAKCEAGTSCQAGHCTRHAPDFCR